jgi:hypothetical protein
MDSNFKKQQNLLLLITENMKEMETELRAHSIVFEALADGVIASDQIAEGLDWARNSTAMLEFVRKKYLALEKLCATGTAPAENSLWFPFGGLEPITH